MNFIVFDRSFFNKHKGDHVAAGFQDGCVAVWSYPVGEMVFRVKQHLEEVIAIYWSPSKHELFATYDRVSFKLPFLFFFFFRLLIIYHLRA
jgi:WD40 repeat protein